jgi:GAF domain-containing protein
VTSASDLIERAGLNDHGLDVRLNRMCATAVRITRADQAEINISNHEHQQFLGLCPVPRVNGPAGLSKESGCIFVVTHDIMVVLDDVRTHPHFASKAWAGKRVQSYIGLPVHFEGVAVASLCAYTVNEPHHWTDPEILVMQGVAKMVEACFPLPPRS